MKKFFDKFIKVYLIVVLSLLVLVGLVYTIGIIFFKEQTQQIADIIGKGLNTPLGIVCGSTLTIGAVLIIGVRFSIKYFIDNSKYGKGSLEELKRELNESNDRCEKLLEENKNLQEIAKVSLGQVMSETETTYDFVQKALETSPNVKLNAIGKEMKEYKAKSQQLADEKIKEIKEKFVEPTIKEKIDILYSKLGESYEQGKETTN